jgi:glycosyltransferase involved in cell wall biosynthesis
MVWAKKLKIPLIGSIHILPENMITPFYRLKSYKKIENFFWWYLVYFFNIVNHVTIPTQTGAEIYKKKGLKARITPISNGLKTEIFNPKNNGEYLKEQLDLPDKNIVLCTGRINEEKNLDVLIKAIPHVIKNVNAHFLIVGEGGDYKKSLIDLAHELKVDKYTTFSDFLDWEDYPNIYSIADVFTLPSEAELQSLVTMEAVATGLPIVVVNKGALPELASMNNGLVFESQNCEQMAECIIRILSDEQLKEKMSNNSLNLIKKHSIQSVAEQYEKEYKKVINKTKK